MHAPIQPPPADPSSARAVRRPGDADSRANTARTPDRLKRACQEMESLFINQLLKQMRQAIPKGGLLGDSSAEEMFTDMHDAELARTMAGAGGLGLAQMLMAQLSRNQAMTDGALDAAAAPPLKVSPEGTDNPTERQLRNAAEAVVSVAPADPETHRHRRGTPWK